MAQLSMAGSEPKADRMNLSISWLEHSREPFTSTAYSVKTEMKEYLFHEDTFSQDLYFLIISANKHRYFWFINLL